MAEVSVPTIVKQLCEECGVTPTNHKCTVCRIVFLCPTCCYNRGYDDLNNRPCTKCDDNVVYSVSLATPSVAEPTPIIATAKRVAPESENEPNPKRQDLPSNNMPVSEIVTPPSSNGSETSTLTDVQQAPVSVDNTQHASTSSGITLSSFKQSDLIAREVRDEGDSDSACDSEGEIGPFLMPLDDDASKDDDVEPDTPHADGATSEVMLCNAETVDHEKLTVPELKEKLKEFRLRVSGKKSELILRLKEAMERGRAPVNADIATPASTMPQKHWEELTPEDAPVPQPNNPLRIVDPSGNEQN